MACISNALIVGGSIAGLTAAISLARRGIDCEVVEIGDSHLGASLAFSGRAAMAIDELGIYDVVADTGRPFEPGSSASTMRNSAGDLISAGPQRPSWPGYVDPVAIYRPTFIQVLEKVAVDIGVKIHKKTTWIDFTNADDGISVTLSNGETRTYDLMIGADGIRSKTRAKVFPDAPEPQYTGQWSIRWMVPGAKIEPEGWYMGPVGRLGFYYMPVQELLYVAAVIDVPEARRLSDDEVRALRIKLLDSYTAPAIVELRSHLTETSELIGKSYEWVFVPDTWHKGRVLLIGDAAHATTSNMGQGAGMAVEDSAVLGQCFADAVSLPDALDAFMKRRYERVKFVVETSVELASLDQRNAPASETVALLTAAFETIGQTY